MMEENKIPKKALDLSREFYDKFAFPEDDLSEDQNQVKLLQLFDKKNHYMCGNEDFRSLLKSAMEDFLEGNAVWDNEKYCYSEVSSGDAMVRIEYDKDFNHIMVSIYRLEAEKVLDLDDKC